MNITTNQSPRFTVPATILPHAVRGLNLLKKVGFDAPQLKSADKLIPRFHDLTTKTVAEHRTRMTLIDASALKAGLLLQAEWFKTGRQTVDVVIPETIERLGLFLAGKPVPSPAVASETESTDGILSAGIVETSAVEVL